MAKRIRKVDAPLPEACPLLLDELWQFIITIPLRDFMHSKKEGNHLILDVFYIPLVSKDWHRYMLQAIKELKFSWLERMQHFDHRVGRHSLFLAYEQKCGVNIEELLKQARTSSFYIEREKVIREEILDFMAKNNISYRSPSGKVYTGYVGMRKLGRIKVTPREKAERYKAMFVTYNTIHEKNLAIIREMDDWFNNIPVTRYFVITKVTL
jgi:hypothetical protein